MTLVLGCRHFTEAGLPVACCPNCHTHGPCAEQRPTHFPPPSEEKMAPLRTLVYGHLCCGVRALPLTRSDWARALVAARRAA